MATIEVKNDFAGWLVVWLEPLGEDRWLRPGDVIRIRSDYTGNGADILVELWADDEYRADGIENMTVWIQYGSPHAEVTDGAGDPVQCGHQRPAEIAARWETQRVAALGRLHARQAADNLRSEGGALPP